MKTAVVTGAAGGIGLALIKRLLGDGWSVAALVHGPSEELSALAQGCDGRLGIFVGDLADATSRRGLIDGVAAAEPKVDALFNVAGVNTAKLRFSPQGRELHYEVNTVAPYVVLVGLTEALASAGGRVVNVVSDAIFFDKRFDPQRLDRPWRFRKVTGPYATSKLALALWGKAIAGRLAERGIVLVSVTPGPIRTAFNRGPGLPLWMRLIVPLIERPTSHAVETLMDAATKPYPPGSFVMKGNVRELSFADKADATLRAIERAAN